MRLRRGPGGRWARRSEIDLVALEVVRLGERDAELGRVVDAGELAAHPFA